MTEDSLNKIDQRLRQTELKKDDLKEIDTLVLKDTSIVNLNTELFQLFNIKHVIIDSDRLLRTIHVTNVFGKRMPDGQMVVALKTLRLENLKNVAIY